MALIKKEKLPKVKHIGNDFLYLQEDGDYINEKQFLNNMNTCMSNLIYAKASLQSMPYKNSRIKKTIKKLDKEISMLAHDINIEERWQNK